MSALLNQAIATLNLQPGETYRTKVNGHDVEVRVLDAPAPAVAAEEPSQFANMEMLDPWFTIPDAPTVQIVHAKLGPPVPFDPPIIPLDDELPEDERAD